MQFTSVLLAALLAGGISSAFASGQPVGNPLSLTARLNNPSCTVALGKTHIVYPIVTLPLKEEDVLGQDSILVAFSGCPKGIPVSLTVHSTPVGSHFDEVKNTGSAKGVYLQTLLTSKQSMTLTPEGSTEAMAINDAFQLDTPYQLNRTLSNMSYFMFNPRVIVSQKETGEVPDVGHYYFPVDFIFNAN
ncbi:TPA: hypothetical protein ACQ39K_004832 [Yersinia enterocolitica]